MKRLHLQLALDHCTLADAARMATIAAPVVDTVEVGTPLIVRSGVAAISTIREQLTGTSCQLFADTKISDEGETIARLCFEAGADAVSVVDGGSRETLQAVRTVAGQYGRQVWVDLLGHSNPIIRARAIAPYVDGFVLHRPYSGLPPLLIDGLMGVDRPIRFAGGLTLAIARRAAAIQRANGKRPDEREPMEGIIIGRAITEAEDFQASLAAFAAICNPDRGVSPSSTREGGGGEAP